MNNRSLMIYQGLPALVLALPFIGYLIFGSDRFMKGEAGIIENLTVLFLCISIGFCLSSMNFARAPGMPKTLKFWLLILIAGAAYFALEEISYGQHLFGWGTADTWKELNDQDETNLHNVHAIFDQVPRGLLTLGILIGGVIMPLYRHFRRIELQESNRLFWQWPTLDCVTIGLMVILVRPILDAFEFEFINIGEVKEVLFALFILLYCVSLQSRLKRRFRAAEAD